MKVVAGLATHSQGHFCCGGRAMLDAWSQKKEKTNQSFVSLTYEGVSIRAELTGRESAEACGLVANGPSPLLALCRKLVAAGNDPARPLEAYRGDTLCLHV